MRCVVDRRIHESNLNLLNILIGNRSNCRSSIDYFRCVDLFQRLLLDGVWKAMPLNVCPVGICDYLPGPNTDFGSSCSVRSCIQAEGNGRYQLPWDNTSKNTSKKK